MANSNPTTTFPTLQELCLKFRLFQSGELTDQDKQLLLDVLLQQKNGDDYKVNSMSPFLRVRCAAWTPIARGHVPCPHIYSGQRVMASAQATQERVFQDVLRFTTARTCKQFCISKCADVGVQWLFPSSGDITSDRLLQYSHYHATYIKMDPFDILASIQDWNGQQSIQLIADIVTKRLDIRQDVSIFIDYGEPQFRDSPYHMASVIQYTVTQ